LPRLCLACNCLKTTAGLVPPGWRTFWALCKMFLGR
jgi:hypothetical protein